MKHFLLVLMALMPWGDKCWLTSCNAGDENVSATNSISDPQFHGQPLSYWLTHLYHYVGSAWTIDHDSEKAVLQIGSNAVPMLSSWITKPEGGGWGQPDHAVEAFQLLGPTAKAAVPDLIKAIGQNQNYPERALVYIGKDAVPLLADKLVETLSETNNPYYDSGIRMAVRTTNGFYIRDRILGVLAQLGTNAEAALPALIQMVATNRHQPYFLREGNWIGGGFFQDPYNVLARVGQNQPEIVVPILLNEFSNSPWPVVETQRFAAAIETQRRNHIIQAMKVWATNQAKAFMPVLIAALSDNRTNDWSRIQMGDTLTEVGSNQPAVLIPVFLAGLTNKANDEHIQCGLAGSLFKIAREQPDIVVPALIMVYTNSGIEVRCSIAGMLATFGDKSRSMVPTLIQDSRSKELPINRPGWKIDLAVAAKKIAPENTNALSALIDDFDSCDGGTKQWRFRAFGELGTNAWETVPTMLKFLTNDTTQIRCDAIGALDAVGVKSDAYIQILSRVVSATNVFVSRSAQSSLCSLAADSQLAFEAVLKFVISAPVDRDEVQKQAIWRLTELSRQNPKFLVNCLDSPDPAVRSGDLVVLYHLNKCVRESFGKLFMMSAKEPDAAIRTLADFVHHQQLGLQ